MTQDFTLENYNPDFVPLERREWLLPKGKVNPDSIIWIEGNPYLQCLRGERGVGLFKLERIL